MPFFSPYKSQQTDVLQSVKHQLLNGVFQEKFKPEHSRAEANIIFLLDTSGSMAANQQMGYVKGMIEQTLKKQRHKKIRYAMILLEGETAKICQPFTQNQQLISQFNYGLRNRGKTNLGAAFIKVQELSRSLDKSSVQLFAFTDGKANVGDGENAPFEYALQCYKKHVGSRIRSTIVDTEQGMVRIGKARELAGKLGVRYLAI